MPLRVHVPTEDKMLLDELSLVFEKEEPSSKGFAGEKIGEVRAVLSKLDISE